MNGVQWLYDLLPSLLTLYIKTFSIKLMYVIFLMYQESGRHAETLDAITKYLDMGVYSEWDEERRLEFLTRELKGKRPLVPLSIEVMLILICSIVHLSRPIDQVKSLVPCD